jgi:phosphotransferase system HPr-like phosphotransfer protein
VNVEITLDEAEIASIEVSVTGADEYEACMEFKKFLAQNYETDSSNISVYPKN